MKLELFLLLLTSFHALTVCTKLSEESLDGTNEIQRCSCQIQDGRSIIYGADFNITNYATRENLCGKHVASNLINGTKLGYYNVNFGNQPSRWLSMTFTNSREEAISGKVYVFADRINAHPIATMPVSRVKYLCGEIIIAIEVNTELTGIHDVYFLFTVFSPRPYEQVLELSWFTFSKIVNDFTCPHNQLLMRIKNKQG